MTLRPKFALAATTVVLAGSVFAACGGDDEDSTSSAPAAAQTAEPMSGMASDQDVVALAQDTPELSTLVDAVTAADLVGTLQGDGPFTVFAPTNDAFAELGGAVDQLLKPRNKDQLTSVLTYHVVPGELMAADLKDGQKLKTVNGERLPVSIDGSTVKVGGATVAMPDVEASNGVVHVIDGVLQPEA